MSNREHQKYDADGRRLVCGCVPFRWNENGSLEVAVILSRKNKVTWILPKGGWENYETAKEAAERETWEEAGLKGQCGECIYEGEHVTKKGSHTVEQFFPLEVTEIFDVWPEGHERERRFVSISKATTLCKRPNMVSAILKLQAIHSGDVSSSDVFSDVSTD